jgi:hypothetical protein
VPADPATDKEPNMSNTDKKNTAPTLSTTVPPASGQAKPPTNGTSVSPGNGTPAPAAAAPSDASPPAAADPAAGTGAQPTEDESDPLLYFIVTGPINSFKTVAKAEKFLNEPGAPTEYTVIRGRAAPAKKRVSLRG